MSTNNTFITRLEQLLSDIYQVIDTMMDNSEIYYHDSNGARRNFIVLGSPVNHYRKRDERSQLIARELFKKFIEQVELLLTHANPQTVEKIKGVEKKLLNFISQSSHGVPSSTDSGKSLFRKQFEIFTNFLNLFKTESATLILVPDTNALIQFPDPSSYQKLFGRTFTFLILPTVLSELDKLKVGHRSEDFRHKVKSVIKRLKGFRNQGDVLQGVTVAGSINVKMVATEPNFEKTLQWLDTENQDDRIIASTLDVQVRNPTDQVVLITSDLNLQNKAQTAMLNFVDTDDLEETAS
ncbi:hypothetical protein KXQ82_11330 [Mucilaginibacter sp. HMF5004]|uniref:PIN domain-containing protein n=1 Tax=Mucilaginibacter rivuli TaxID=2857527 RepID=UPI001C606EAE|nr:PIN domain-containing protein [Mucilaginibacter rivuli]MBW4890315.1 hypothetical protein [Mucilaginibacter rivuli]